MVIMRGGVFGVRVEGYGLIWVVFILEDFYGDDCGYWIILI